MRIHKHTCAHTHTHTHTQACAFLTEGSCWQAYVRQIMTSDTTQRTACLRTESAARLANNTHTHTHINTTHLLSNTLQLQTTGPLCHILGSKPDDKHVFFSTEKNILCSLSSLSPSLRVPLLILHVYISLIISFQSFIKSGTPMVH